MHRLLLIALAALPLRAAIFVADLGTWSATDLGTVTATALPGQPGVRFEADWHGLPQDPFWLLLVGAHDQPIYVANVPADRGFLLPAGFWPERQLAGLPVGLFAEDLTFLAWGHFAAVPEPASAAAIGVGLLAFTAWRRRSRPA